MPPFKRQKVSRDDQNDDNDSSDGNPASDGSVSDDISDDSDDNTSDNIPNPRPQKSRQTSKRKLRATGASTFGAALQGLLSTDVPSALPLSLKPSIARQRNDEKLELRAKRVLQLEKKEKEDKGRITDVIGGWGGESERALRKVAQRGVVKLFNAIQQTQNAASIAADDTKAARGSGKPTLPAPVIDNGKKRKLKNHDGILGKGKESTVGKDDFFDMIRSGGIVSKV